MKRLNEKTSQQSIQNYFKITDVTSRKELKVSKRVRLALDQMAADPDAPSTSTEVEVIEKKKSRKRKEKATEEKSDVEESPVKKPTQTRKRKNKEPMAHGSNNDNELVEPSGSIEAGTTTATTRSSKKVVLPDNNEPIPQREKDKQAMEHNKLKAIEILKQKKSKCNKK